MSREHETTSRTCWCGPTYYIPCDCGEDEYTMGAARVHVTLVGDSAIDDAIGLSDPPRGCWKCERGLLVIDRAAAMSTDEPLIVVHRA